ncbi:hypothetical protein E2C01_037020 [Portunus trituberculatus]|uniref:Uncharacterized protein n=1 Tax=Portunus trituberculatus TaxID=210409 RepID=A0A5B7FDI1_PORTR|nr:hypothetical protein [Portunus trituberculatus]
MKPLHDWPLVSKGGRVGALIGSSGKESYFPSLYESVLPSASPAGVLIEGALSTTLLKMKEMAGCCTENIPVRRSHGANQGLSLTAILYVNYTLFSIGSLHTPL